MVATHTEQAQQQAELQKRLWAIANDLRGNMDASEFRNYILGLIFYRFLSERVQMYANQLLQNDSYTFSEAYQDEDYRDDLVAEIKSSLGFFIEPKALFDSMIQHIQAGNFDIEMLQDSINEVQSSTIGQESEDDFKGLFEDMDLASSRLGSTVAERSELIAKVMMNLADIDFHENELKIDVLGDAYEYLIGQFAATAGKKAGEFYTPQQVSKVLSQLVTLNREEVRTVYDPTMGSGSLLLRVGDYAKVAEYYGQELNGTTYNLARMNMLMHGINYSRFDLRQGDTLENDQFPERTFDAVVANPPYSANWNATDKLDDERFRKYGKTAPKSKADFAFVEHMLYHLKTDGRMAVVLPHGVLFRGAAEGKIRQYMIEKDNVLDAVIGMPANLFYGTSIPTVVLVFDKSRINHDILFIDASKDFEKGKNQNNLTDENVKKIIDIYKDRKDVKKFAHVADFKEIKENEFNLNIPRYVDTFEPEPPVDVDKLVADIKDTDEQISKLESEFSSMLDDLEGKNPVAQQQLTKIKELFKNE
ncbi:type I restriction-modification system subunit M [Lentilactobacillus hilgardii]|uniref:type I restriction-modification system subunit M n=1 Tax=Lentilactobacillus hilgardii TaxID=1588 RepID=UPI0021C2BE2C|nr:type I restriction-modification system subunit M [Lentilactobacillus hilgardii]MCP9333310.1 type I restriction-modification system subunit M [Lentilactobacillus hilgardii]MCP9349919.1 type I restriction-modification system subunit M [Lentilactobacillus hilgardii]MCP9352847.1 type I restriction-modification system subunit M [Lentilactobacillus hilgardii]